MRKDLQGMKRKDKAQKRKGKKHLRPDVKYGSCKGQRPGWMDELIASANPKKPRSLKQAKKTETQRKRNYRTQGR